MAQVCDVEVEAFGDYDMDGKRFVVRSMYEDTKENDLEFKQYADYVKSHLIYKGAILAHSAQDADIIVMLGYGVNDSGSRISAMSSAGFHFSSGFWSASKVNSEDNYIRYIYLSAYSKNLTDGEPEMVWKTKIISQGTTGSLSEVFPIMIYEARNNLGHHGRRSISAALSAYEPSQVSQFNDFCYTILYDMVKRGYLLTKHFYKHISATGNTITQKTKMTIEMALLDKDKLTVYFSGSPNNSSLHKTIYMEQDGREFPKIEGSLSSRGILDGRYYYEVSFQTTGLDTDRPFSIRDKRKPQKSCVWENVVLQ